MIGRRMCDFFTTILVAGVLYSGCLTPDAEAQWQVPVNTIPIGRGAGVTGFDSAANTGTGTLCLLNTAPPAFAACPGGGGGGTPSAPANSVQYNNAGAFGGNVGLTYTAGGPLTIAPTSGTNNKGLILNQTIGFGTQSSGPYSGNLNTIINNGYTSTASGFSTTTGLLNALSIGERTDYSAAGTGAGTGPIFIGKMVTANATSRGQQLVASHSSASINLATGGQDYIWGFTGYTYVGPSANIAGSFAVDAQSAIVAGATIANRVGVSIETIADGSASGIDSAIAIASVPSPLAVTTVPFRDGITFWTGGSTQPIATTGSVLTANAAFTATNFANFPSSTFSGNILNFSNLKASGTGGAIFGAGSGAAPITGVRISSTNAGGLLVSPNADGATSPTLVVDPSATSAVNGIGIVGTATANPPNINALGPSANVGMLIEGKGTGQITFGNYTTGSITVNVGNPGTVSGTLGIAGSVAGAQNITVTGTAAGGIASLPIGTYNIVGDTITATLTNKTLTTPVINGLPTGTGVATANTASTLVARDGSGNFSAGTITASLTGHSSLDCALTGCTMSGAIAMGTNAVTGLTTLAAAGALTFQSNGTTFAGNISTGQQWLIGTTVITPASNVQLTVSKNTGTPALGPISGTIADFINVDSTVTRLAIRSFGAGAAGTGVIYYAAGGTAASPTQTLSGNPIGVNFGFGYNAAGSAYATGAGSGFQMVAAENFDNTHAGSDFEIVTTPTGSTTQAVVAKFWGSGGLSLATGAGSDPGANSFSAAGQVFVPNITQTSAAQTGTVCWTTGTGKFTVDTTAGCLTSIIAAKNITERLAPAKALDIVVQLDPFAFRYKPGWGDSGRYEQFGFGAEQVAMVDERMVGRDPEGTLQGVRYQELTAVLAGAIQQLKIEIDGLKRGTR